MTLEDGGDMTNMRLDALVKLAEEGRPTQVVAVARVVIPALVREVKTLRELIDKLRGLEKLP